MAVSGNPGDDIVLATALCRRADQLTGVLGHTNISIIQRRGSGFGQKPDEGLCNSNEGRFLKEYLIKFR